MKWCDWGTVWWQVVLRLVNLSLGFKLRTRLDSLLDHHREDTMNLLSYKHTCFSFFVVVFLVMWHNYIYHKETGSHGNTYTVIIIRLLC